MTNRKKLLLFVHGLGGKGKATWGSFETLIAEDSVLHEFDVAYYTYPTVLISVPFFKKPVRVQDLAAGLKTMLEYRYAQYEEVYLIAHSLGGLLVKKYLLSQAKIGELGRIKGVMFYAVPHNGAGLAAVAKHISWKHAQLEQLCKSSDLIDAINTDWQGDKAIAEMKQLYVVAGSDRVVDVQSASAFYGNRLVEMVVDKGHSDLVKPTSTDDLSFLILKNFVQKASSEPEEASVNIQLAEGKKAHIDHDQPAASSLFTVYAPSCEKFYLQRNVDGKLREAVLAGNTWICGPTGCGKTVAAARCLDKNGMPHLYIILAHYTQCSTAELMAAIYSYICEKANRHTPLNPSDDTRSIIEKIVSLLGGSESLLNSVIFIEEIPLRDEADFQDFAKAIYSLVVLLSARRAGHNVRFLLSTIHSPKSMINKDQGKIFEQIRFIEMDYWSKFEIRSLIDIIAHDHRIPLTSGEISEIVDASQGSPRFVKNLLRAYASQYRLPEQSLTKLIGATQRDLQMV